MNELQPDVVERVSTFLTASELTCFGLTNKRYFDLILNISCAYSCSLWKYFISRSQEAESRLSRSCIDAMLQICREQQQGELGILREMARRIESMVRIREVTWTKPHYLGPRYIDCMLF